MKNLNTTKIDKEVDIVSMVQFKVMEGKADKALESLNNPVDIVEARANLVKVISKDSKLKKYIPLQTDVLDKILFLAFKENLEISQVLDLFVRKNTPLITLINLAADEALANAANRPANDPRYEPEIKNSKFG